MSTRDTHRSGEEIVKAPSGQVGKEFQSAKVTLAGSAPHSITFSSLGLEDMKNVDYVVMPHGETSARVTVDESTISETGFDLLGGAATEVVHLVIHGQIAGR